MEAQRCSPAILSPRGLPLPLPLASLAFPARVPPGTAAQLPPALCMRSFPPCRVRTWILASPPGRNARWRLALGRFRGDRVACGSAPPILLRPPLPMNATRRAIETRAAVCASTRLRSRDTRNRVTRRRMRWPVVTERRDSARRFSRQAPVRRPGAPPRFAVPCYRPSPSGLSRNPRPGVDPWKRPPSRLGRRVLRVRHAGGFRSPGNSAVRCNVVGRMHLRPRRPPAARKRSVSPPHNRQPFLARGHDDDRPKARRGFACAGGGGGGL